MKLEVSNIINIMEEAVCFHRENKIRSHCWWKVLRNKRWRTEQIRRNRINLRHRCRPKINLIKKKLSVKSEGLYRGRHPNNNSKRREPCIWKIISNLNLLKMLKIGIPLEKSSAKEHLGWSEYANTGPQEKNLLSKLWQKIKSKNKKSMSNYSKMSSPF